MQAVGAVILRHSGSSWMLGEQPSKMHAACAAFCLPSRGEFIKLFHMELIDSHCHLLGFKNKRELEPALERAAAAGVQRFITVGTGLKDWVPYREMSAAYPGKIDYSVGLHPCYVDADWNDTVAQLSTFFMPPNAPVALGEIGLDYFIYPKIPSKPVNSCSIRKPPSANNSLSLASSRCRSSFTAATHLTTFRMIDESGVDWSRIVFHCYSYGPDEISRINQRGGRGSFTGIVTYKNAPEIREALRCQGIAQLMLETDCPYLSPEPHRGKPNEPAYLANNIARRCAEALALSEDELAAHATANTKTFFNLGQPA